MDRRKIRTYPPTIVSFVVGIGLTVATLTSISSTAQIKAEGGSLQEQESQQTIQATAIIEAADIACISETEPEATSESTAMGRSFGTDECQMLIKIAMAEAEGETTEGKALVMLVVLNRVKSDKFPNTVEEVIFQPKQFSPVQRGGRYYTTVPNEDCYEALELVESGWDESDGALYFESCKSSSWHSKNLKFLFQLGNHKFYR